MPTSRKPRSSACTQDRKPNCCSTATRTRPSIEGRIDSLFAASGAQFSLLPPDNTTGNFTKVVQRIPVKLTFAADNPLAGKIRPGMSVEVQVDIASDAQHGG